MKTTRKYDIAKPNTAHGQALHDVKEYCTDQMWLSLLDYLRACSSEADVHFGCSMMGIEGYPCKALFKEYVQSRVCRCDKGHVLHTCECGLVVEEE